MWFAPALHILLEPLRYLQRYIRDHYICMGEHKAQLHRARQSFRANLEHMVTFWKEEDFKAAQAKQRELGAARHALEKAARALARRRHSQRAY